MKGDIIACYQDDRFLNKIFGWLIRFFTKSDYVHVAIMSDDYDTIIEAVTPGVQQTKNYWKKFDTFRVKDILPYQVDMALNFARKEIGDWYDFKALIYLAYLYITLQRKKINEWRSENQWFCSELVASSFRKAGIILCPDIPDASTSPEDITESKLLYKVGG